MPENMNFTVYSKDGCPYCSKVVEVLKLTGLKHVVYKLGEHFDRKSFYGQFGEGSTFPQVVVNGKKVNIEKKTFPGYVLVRMDLDDETWYQIRNTPSVIGFVGSGKMPQSLSRREIERILGTNEEVELKKESPKFKPDFEVGETVRVTTGPFADFNGIIEEINLDQSKVTVLVNIFGRETPVELGFTDIVKN